MQRQGNQDKQSSRPIIDKILIYGVLNSQSLTISRLRQNQVKVGIIKAYSYNTQTRQVIQTTQIQQDKYQIWVYPDGIKIYDASYKIINDDQPEFSFFQPNIMHTQKVVGNIQTTDDIRQPQQNIYSFVMTDYDLNRTYCTCLVWNEKKFVQNDAEELTTPEELQKTVVLKNAYGKIPNQNSKILPKCTLNELVQDPLVLDPTSCLVYIPKGLIICSKHPCLKFQRDLSTFIYMNGIKKCGQATIRNKQMQKIKKLIAKFGYPQAQKLYDQEQFLQQVQTRYKQQEKQLPIQPSKLRSKKTYLRLQRQKVQTQLNLKNLRNLQKRKLQQFYLSFAFLPELVQSHGFLEIPSQLLMIQDTITQDNAFEIEPYYYSATCFKIPNFNILETINRIGIDIIMTLWKSAVLQRQILVFSSDQFLTIELFQTLLYLLQPFKWQNIYIPFLPFHLCHHIQALGGYFIGMSKIHMDYMIEHFNLQTKVFVDLDQMIIIQEGGTNDISIPAQIQTWMVRQLQQLGFKDKQNKERRNLLWNFNLSRLVNKQEKKAQMGNFSQQRTMKTIFDVHKVFYIGLFYLLNNYSSYIQEDGTNIKFDRQKYNQIFTDQTYKKFASQLVKTMMFVRLCQFHKDAQKSLKWNQADICSLFVYCHQIMKQDQHHSAYWSLKHFDIQLDDELRVTRNKQIQNAQKLNQYVNYVIKKNFKQLTGANVESKTYKVEHYLVKYLNYLNYNHPGIVRTQQNKNKAQQFQFFDWIWEVLRRENIQKQQKKKKQKLNKLHDFWRGDKRIVDLQRLFSDVGSELYGEFKKNILLQSWNNAKILEKMNFNRENAKSSQSQN